MKETQELKRVYFDMNNVWWTSHRTSPCLNKALTDSLIYYTSLVNFKISLYFCARKYNILALCSFRIFFLRAAKP